MIEKLSRTTACFLGALICASAGASDVNELQKSVVEMRQKIKAVTDVSPAGFLFVESEQGNYVMSKNGRIAVVNGEVLDVWTGRKITSTADAVASTRYPAQLLSKVGINIEELGGLRLGSGERVVTIFTPVGSKHTQDLMKRLDAMVGQYRFDVYPLPGSPSDQAGPVAVTCAETNEQKHQILRSGAKTTGSCPPEKAQKIAVVADLIGLKKVPAVIAPNGVISQGVPANLESFLGANNE